jgi:TnpA family transposase
MSIHFLSKAEIHHLNSLPNEIARADLTTSFELSKEDLHVLKGLRGDHNRLGVAMLLGCLRHVGFFPTNLPDASSDVVDYVAKQLGIDQILLEQYGQREKTLNTHHHLVLQHLGFRRATPMDVLDLEQWLLERALEHDKPKLLFELACDQLRRNKIVRPGLTQLARMVGTARAEAERVSSERLQSQLGQTTREFLDSLLVSESGHSRLPWLQHTPSSNTTAAILKTLDKLTFLHEHKVADWSLNSLNPNRLKWLAKKGSRASTQGLRDLKEQARYPILMAFLQEALYTFTDAVIEMVDARLWELYNEAKHSFKNDRLAATQTINETLTVFKHIGQVLLDKSIEETTVRKLALEHLAEGQLETALTKAEQLIRPEQDDFSDYFAKNHSKVEKFSKRYLQGMVFLASSDDEGLLEGLEVIKAIHNGTKRKIPTTAPTAFIPSSWFKEVFRDDGLDWKSYEIAALWVLRQKLRSGDVYLQHSRRFTELERYLIPKHDWLVQRHDAPGLLGIPLTAETFLEERFALLKTLAYKVEALLSAEQSDIREENGEIIVTPLEMEKPDLELKKLRKLIDERLPKCGITDILIEVDNWTHFSNAFQHLDGVQSRDRELLTQQYACLITQACNIGFKPMAEAADLPYNKLLWCNRWYLRDTTLDDALTLLINYHHTLPFAEFWGSGLLSSSDGQRFPVRGDTRKARALPRYFGYGKGITFYTWTSDQFSQYGTKVIPSTIRDATYVLDAILDNETDLDIIEHTTDTAGYTEIVFALFSLLGLTFSPRIRDLADQQLYRLALLGLETLPLLGSHLVTTLNEERIGYQWDEMLRYAVSLKKGYGTASLLIQKLQAYPRQHPITKALQEFGRLEKTIHILRWYEDIYTRKRVSRQLNKGEALHYLRSHLLFGKHGEIEGMEDEPLDLQAACLNLVTNAIVIFNTVHMAKAIEDLRREGHDIRDNDLARVWPSRFSHINFLGKYHFNVDNIRPGEHF